MPQKFSSYEERIIHEYLESKLPKLIPLLSHEKIAAALDVPMYTIRQAQRAHDILPKAHKSAVESTEEYKTELSASESSDDFIEECCERYYNNFIKGYLEGFLSVQPNMILKLTNTLSDEDIADILNCTLADIEFVRKNFELDKDD